jgi:acetyltransferase-like isoleucine patch superfamily enzyme
MRFSFNNIANPIKIANFLLRRVRGWYYTFRYVNAGVGKIVFGNAFTSVKFIKRKKSTFHLDGVLTIASHSYVGGSVVIVMERNASLVIKKDFSIGPGVQISLMSGAILSIGGQLKESGSGITSNSILMVKKSLKIGYDFICAWDVYITDCDWHQISGQEAQADVEIGNHVWIANSCNILKGTKIGDNCIIASNSKLINKQFDDDSLIAGIPAKIIKNDIQWSRDMER